MTQHRNDEVPDAAREDAQPRSVFQPPGKLILSVMSEPLRSVHFALTGPSLLTHDVDISSSDQTQALFVGALEAGSYEASLTAVAVSGASCSGSQAFTLSPGSTTSVTIPLSCK
jgi:hypothetical protein